MNTFKFQRLLIKNKQVRFLLSPEIDAVSTVSQWTQNSGSLWMHELQTHVDKLEDGVQRTERENQSPGEHAGAKGSGTDAKCLND